MGEGIGSGRPALQAPWVRRIGWTVFAVAWLGSLAAIAVASRPVDDEPEGDSYDYDDGYSEPVDSDTEWDRDGNGTYDWGDEDGDGVYDANQVGPTRPTFRPGGAPPRNYHVEYNNTPTDSYGGGDLDCADVGHEVYVGGNDPNGLDGDGDGYGCDGW